MESTKTESKQVDGEEEATDQGCASSKRGAGMHTSSPARENQPDALPAHASFDTRNPYLPAQQRLRLPRCHRPP